MVIRTSISFTTVSIQDAVKEVSLMNYRGNASAYIEGLIIEDLVNKGYDKKQLLNEQFTEKEID